jgi:ubiquitin carboxyl-terminal hydrolase 14
MGSKEEVPSEPQEKPKFIEDMNESELASALELPAGLTNLGNTCYMNATVQCLKSVHELRESLKDFKNEMSLASAQSITFALKGVFEQMDKNTTVTPVLLLQTLHMAFPNFAQTGENGAYRQQDANEVWSELLKMLQQKLPPKTGTNSTKYSYVFLKFLLNLITVTLLFVYCSSLIDQYFGGTFDVEMKCTEAAEEESSKSKDNFLQLSCFISPEVKYMHSGLRSVRIVLFNNC